tara:strand:- start:989 stop:1117 length:129 start_codon:yes stop_codon:yes gene_type:complete
MSQNGKGDKNRTSNYKKYNENFDKINWQKPSGILTNKQKSCK